MRKHSRRVSRPATPAGAGNHVSSVPISRLYRPSVLTDPDLRFIPRHDPAQSALGYLFQLCGGGRRVLRQPARY